MQAFKRAINLDQWTRTPEDISGRSLYCHGRTLFNWLVHPHDIKELLLTSLQQYNFIITACMSENILSVFASIIIIYAELRICEVRHCENN